ncbi:hypothetical protein L6452_39952 [Arctium lappa]|uniref:Uncharacterized protein n=1 Tax=Arctium lappa TaxID=4217 RepID=A0ACB8XT24_ARCLA|nr:hypothetical protein L6452_39952 [Arctium lappa]
MYKRFEMCKTSNIFDLESITKFPKSSFLRLLLSSEFSGMGRRHLLYLLYTSSVRPPASTPYFIAPPPFLIRKGYSQESSSKGNNGHETMTHERAPSTLEEFKRLEEDKASQGVASQTVEKGKNGVVEAATGDGSFESVKESFKETVGVGDFRRPGEE